MAYCIQGKAGSGAAVSSVAVTLDATPTAGNAIVVGLAADLSNSYASMSYLLILAGFAGLMLGGEMLVRGAVAVAERFRVSPIVIGVTLVGFGTSMPELLTSVQAALAGAPGIAVGNVVGSNIVNILLILGATAAIKPIAVGGAAFRRDGTVMALATALCLAAGWLPAAQATSPVVAR